MRKRRHYLRPSNVKLRAAFCDQYARDRGSAETGLSSRRTMYLPRRHWLEYDPVALAVLVIGIAIIELLALII
jgi:hypothetical protein